MNVKSRRFEKS